MLSAYLRDRTALFDKQASLLSLNHLANSLTIDRLPPNVCQIVTLSLNHCGMTSLQGIQQFQNLQSLSIKFNDIRDLQELFRIKNKQKIVKLQFEGNQIEYLGAALFGNLKKTFPNLIELNGRNFLQILHKKALHNHSMNKILKRAHIIQQTLAKTVKQQTIKNNQNKSNNQTQSRLSQHSLKNSRRSEKQAQNQSHYEEEEENLMSSRQGKPYQVHTTEKKWNNLPPGDLKENKNICNINVPHNNDISIGAISNIPMTKSVRGSVICSQSPCIPPKKKGLQIFTLNESLQANHQILSQPTATFAMQRQKENIHPDNFVFKQKRQPRYSNYQIPLECTWQEKYEPERPTKRQTYGSDCQYDENSMDCSSSGSQGNLITDSIITNKKQIEQMVERWHQLQVKDRVFHYLKLIPKKRNLPMKRHFQ